MYRHSPVRSQRSKGIKIKHVLQVCLLVAVCFWLIFQVKRSHDKKKEFDANDPKISLSTRARSSDEILTFGRKDLHPKLEETTTGTEIHEETQEHEQEEEDEQEENKQEDEEQDEDKSEEEKDDGGGGGDDENDQEKSDVVEVDQEEVDIIDEDKESDEKENEEKDGEDQSRTENVGVSVDDDGATAHTHEAREEHYKADDASSAVTHDARNLGAQNEIKNGTSDNTNDNDVGLVDNSETAENGTIDPESMNGGTSYIDSHQNGPPSNTTLMTSDSTEAQIITVSEEQGGNSSIATSVGYQSGSNATVTEIAQGYSNSTNISQVLKSSDEENNSDPSKSENLETNNVTEESLDPDEVEHETTDSTHLEEKEVRTDLDTLPEIETEGSNSEDTGAE